MADAGILPGFQLRYAVFLNSIAVVGCPWPTEYVGSKIAGGVKPEVRILSIFILFRSSTNSMNSYYPMNLEELEVQEFYG